MSNAAVTVTGARELRKSMKKAELSLKDMTAIHKHIATVVATEAKRRAPVRTGALRKSVRPAATQTAAIVRVGSNKRVPYAMPIHWGWPSRNVKKNPFVSHAAQATEPIWTKYYLQEVDKILSKIEGTTL